MAEELFSLINCYKIYRDKISRNETVALKGIDLTIFKGEFVSIVGPSGSGKSTLLNIIGGLDLPNAGNVTFKINGAVINLTTMQADKRDRFRIKKIGYLQQKPILLPQYTSYENVELPLVTRGISGARQKAEDWLKRLGIREEAWTSKPRQLSGGERQRVSLASALVFNPILLLADEPTAEVDHETSMEILQLFENLNEEYGMTIVLVTHDQELAKRTHRSFILEDGIIKENKIQSDKLKFTVDLDEYNRITLPAGVSDLLGNPDLIALDEFEEGFIIQNTKMMDAFLLDKQKIFPVDRKRRILLQGFVTKSVTIEIRQGLVILKEVVS